MGLSQNSFQSKQDQGHSLTHSSSHNLLNCWQMLSVVPGTGHTVVDEMVTACLVGWEGGPGQQPLNEESHSARK